MTGSASISYTGARSRTLIHTICAGRVLSPCRSRILCKRQRVGRPKSKCLTMVNQRQQQSFLGQLTMILTHVVVGGHGLQIPGKVAVVIQQVANLEEGVLFIVDLRAEGSGDLRTPKEGINM